MLRGRPSTWIFPGRVHIELRRPLHDPARVEAALARRPGVAWARVNAPLGRMIVAVEEGGPPPDELVRALEAAERVDRERAERDAARAAEEEPPEEAGEAEEEEEGEEPPADLPVGVALAIDAAGFAATLVEWAVQSAPLPAEVAGLAGFISDVPRVRRAVEHALPGHGPWLPLVNATVRGLAPGATGIVLDAIKRLMQLREEHAGQAAFERLEEELTGTPERAGAPEREHAAWPRAGALSSGERHLARPCHLPKGPVETYADRMPLGAAAAGLAGGLMTGRLRRGAQVALAALPAAPLAGRDAYAAELGRLLARRGIVVIDNGALRRLDRATTVVVEDEVLLAGRPSIGEVVPVRGADHEQIAARLYALFDPADPEAVRRDGEWVLGPYDRVPRAGGWAGRRERERLGETAAHVLALTRRDRLRAVVAVDRRPLPDAHALLTAVRRAKLRLVVAGPGPDGGGARGSAEVKADAYVPGGADLAESVRDLQRDGAGVLLVSGDGEALAAADCGVGVTPQGGPPPWGAHILVGGDLRAAALIVTAVADARRVGERGVTLAKAGGGVAALLGLTGRRAVAAGRVLTAVNGAGALSMVQGAWQAHRTMRAPIAPPQVITPWHAMPSAQVLAELDSRAGGLTSEEAARRRPAGARRERPPGLLRAVGEELANPFTAVLATGAAGSAIVGSLVDAGLVLSVVGMSALTGGVQRTATARTVASLSRRTVVRAGVLRDGTEREVDAAELVPGDVILLGSGDVVPADCRILEAEGLEADESSLTGESLPVAKDARPVLAGHVAERRSMLYESTTIAAGRARAVVVAVGEATETGRAMAVAGTAAPPTGVERRLASITRVTTPIAGGAAAAVTLSALLRGVPLRESLSDGVNMAVAAVPEGLPLLVSAAQLAATRRLAARGAYASDPRTIEALGRVGVLCFDKTGTLTEGQIRLARIADRDRDLPAGAAGPELREVLAAALRATPLAEDGEHDHLTDAAVAGGAAEIGVTREMGAAGWREAHAMLFEPSRGYHATLGYAGGERVVSVKGAPETVLPRCVGLDPQALREIEARVEHLASSGHRVLAVAERRFPAPRNGNGHAGLGDEDVCELSFLGLLGLADVVRDTAASAVAGLRAAGVQIVMLTGDHPSTAGAIASHVIGDDRELTILTGNEIDEMADDVLDKVLPGVDVVARCTPSHKVRVLGSFQRLGRVVAMTGDGANDAAAIRLADVGIALGAAGTPAARAAADLVVADDRLETIISALVEGRAMWASVRQALAILVGGNLGEIGYTLLGSLFGGRAPMTGRQFLLVNMLTDLAPALAIAVRAPSKEDKASLLDEGPERSLGTALTRDLVQRATVTAAGAGLGWALARMTGPRRRAATVGLVSLVGTQLAQTLATGGLDRSVLLSALGSALALAAVVQIPGLSHFFGCVPLDPVAWGIAGLSVGAAMLAERVLARKDLPDLPELFAKLSKTVLPASS
ncbi:magnesium-transporting ATPase (P-type) [Thermocatellispora tengchongensis]|uniref:Magnesium-transporting ATPase (P-type) n=1 Tax=Thermocatellispora tengchongensis TaxID=1073253 RepID=A0A840PJ42_9ACTN|nr:HAD-IC family P-type ATPase [Thermocatellispora tengchongensis]MBB5137117.1 magnesium-transporting ATPase (P-type) [Thermocatellispora tengchongensis]